uniref:Uncharacterized protein n=1 Tax=Aegilops tauschii subsp. strangulata TaxID=200361 RepID=A0A453N7M7_AEGTS
MFMYMRNWISCCSALFVRILVCLCLKKLSMSRVRSICLHFQIMFCSQMIFCTWQLSMRDGLC